MNGVRIPYDVRTIKERENPGRETADSPCRARAFQVEGLAYDGAVAQLGERLNGIQEADGSTPFSSTFIFRQLAFP